MKKIIILLLSIFSLTQLLAQKPHPKAIKCFDQAYAEYSKGNYSKALSLLNKALKKSPNYSDVYALQAEIYENQGETQKAINAHKNSIKLAPTYQVYYFYYAKYLYKLGAYAEAQAQLDSFYSAEKKPGFNPKKDKASADLVTKAGKLKESCKLAESDAQNINNLKITNMGPGINTNGYEYWPGMTIDGRYFIFTKLVKDQEDFFLSENIDSVWQNAIPLPGNINTPENEGTTSVSADGRYIFFTVCNQDGFGSCDIFVSAYNPTNNSWSRRVNLGKDVNSAQWDAQPAISADGKTLIFSSARTGGFGGKDLWMTRYSGGKWSTPENLGAEINTSSSEEAPFLHYDGKTLYFSSDGHAGYGGLDIFLSRRSADGKWSKPENLGKGINTISDESGLYVDFKGEKAYFASDREGGYGNLDIYSFYLSPDKKPAPVSYVQGIVYDIETGKEISGRIEIMDLKSNNRVLKDSFNSFFTTLEPGGNYSLNVYRQGYLFYSENFQPTSASIDSPYLVKAYLKPIKSDQRIVLNNIFFDVDQYVLKDESFPELQSVLKLMKANPKMKIEISGHTDNTGSEQHNNQLSENRALAVVNYLKANGIEASRLQSKGFGASQPVADNATAEGRALNRRIEMKVTSL